MVAQNNSPFGPVGKSTKIGDVYQDCTCLLHKFLGKSTNCRLNGPINLPSLQTCSPYWRTSNLGLCECPQPQGLALQGVDEKECNYTTFLLRRRPSRKI